MKFNIRPFEGGGKGEGRQRKEKGPRVQADNGPLKLTNKVNHGLGFS